MPPTLRARLASFFSPSGGERRLLWRMFGVGLLVRVLYMTLAHTYRFRTVIDHFQFGWEMGRIARALATGRGFADPFEGHSGPTAWNPPLYPLLLAAVFKVCGVYTRLSGWVILAINSVFSAATAPLVYRLARRSFAARTGTSATAAGVALWAGWLWALYPAAMQYAVRWVWDMALTACLFTWVLLLALAVRGTGEADPDAARHQTLARWLLFGGLWGLIGLTNSSLLIFLPFCGVWMIWPALRRDRAQLPAAMRNAVAAAAVCCAVMLPWVVRNERVFHQFIPLRSNMGAELYQSMLPINEGFPWGASVPVSVVSAEYREYVRLGEVEFSRRRGAMGREMIRTSPRTFWTYTFKRVYMFWFGVPHAFETDRAGHPKLWSVAGEELRELDFGFISLASLLGLGLMLRERIAGAGLFAGVFLLTPLLYYAVTVQARFRHPLEPLMTVLVVYLFQSAVRTRQGSRARLPERVMAGR